MPIGPARPRRPRMTGALLVLFSFLLGVPTALRGEDPVVLLHWNDLHGQVFPARRSSGELAGGFRGLAALVAEERQRSGDDQVLTLDAGDWFQGSPEGNLTRGRMIVELLNALRVDAAEIGNHEFDYGVPNLRELIDLAEFPVLGANILEPDGSGTADYALRSTIIERGGIRFGVVGVVTESTKSIVIADVAKDLRFADAFDTVRTELEVLRSGGAECLVVLSHLGESAERRLAAEVPGIDLIVGGHSHTLFEVPWVEPTTGTVGVQALCNARYIGRLEITRDGDGFRIEGRAIPVPGRVAPVDPAIEAVIAHYEPDIRAVMETVVGEVPAPMSKAHRVNLLSRDGWHPRANPLGTWIAGEMARVAGTEIALHNRGGVRADLPAGAVTRRDLFQISPFGNTVVRVSLTGAELEEMVSTALAWSPDSDEPPKRFDVHGLTIGWTHGESYGPSKRLASLEVGGRPIDPDASYTIATNNYLAMGGDDWEVLRRAGYQDTGVEVLGATVRGLEEDGALDRLEDAMSAETYVQVGTLPERATSLLGLFMLLGIAWLLSIDRKRVPWRILIWGVALQAVLAAAILRTGPGRQVFHGAKKAFDLVLQFSAEGAQFVFGPLADIPTAAAAFGPENGFIFAIQISATIILVSSVTAILYHLGVMQVIVYLLAKGMQVTMRTSGAESLAAAANIFVGQTEAPLVVRPYLAKLTASETMCLMTGGMATVAGGVLAAYVGFGIDGGHLLAASVMSAPAALAIAKLMVPEKEHPATAADVPFEIRRIDQNLLDAACRGASDGLKLAINVMAMLIAFTALVALVNWGIGAVHTWFLPSEIVSDSAKLAEVDRWSLQGILGYVFAPIAWLLGVPKEEILGVGTLLGIKMTLNEFYGYIELSGMKASLSPRSVTLATYALCGFANFASIAIQIGGISALEEGLRPTLARFGFRAMLGGTLAALMTACVAGVLT